MTAAIGGLILAVLIIGAGGAYVVHVARQVQTIVPQGVRAKAGKKSAHIAESVRTVKARARAEARATLWLEKHRARLAHKTANPRPPVSQTAGKAARALGNGTGKAVRGAATTAKAGLAGTRNGIAAVRARRGQPASPAPVAVPAATSNVTPIRTPAQPAPAASPPPTASNERTPVMAPRTAPPDHAALNARVAGFEPESDGDLLGFMSGEANGKAGYANALEQLNEHLLSGVGLDPASVAAVTEYAQACSEAAAIMVRANVRFQAVYQGVRETVQSGTVLPFKGRWITGESA